MTTYNWKILELTTQENVILEVKYWCQAAKNDLKVETEGYWKFRSKREVFPDISESLVAHWLDLDAEENGHHLIKTRLDEQLESLENAENRDPPWKVETFKVTL